MSNIDNVITYDGTEAKRKDCRFIKGEFYVKHKQCFLIDGMWYRINSNLITLNHSTGEYVLIKTHPELVNGIVGFDKTTMELILGHFTPDKLKNANVFMNNGKVLPAMNYKLLPLDYFKENLDGSGFRHGQYGSSRDFDHKKVTFGNHGYQFPVPYGLRHIAKETVAKIKGESEKHALTSKNDNSFINHLLERNNKVMPYSFGLEFETKNGKVPAYRLSESGLVPLRDGSISGIEYVTVPLQGSLGLMVLDNACKILRKHCEFSENESLHLHLGSTMTSKEFIGTLYTILAVLEKEFYSMFPLYYAQTSKFKSKGKDYNQPLRSDLVDLDPDKTFGNIAFYLSAGKKYPGLGRTHPNDPSDEHKWQIEQRYHWVNFIPMMFGDTKTIEFRVHTPTFDFTKVSNWIMICSAVVKYAENFTKSGKDMAKVKGLELKSVINDIYDIDLATYLNKYIDERKSFMRHCASKNDFVGSFELNKTYSDFR